MWCEWVVHGNMKNRVDPGLPHFGKYTVSHARVGRCCGALESRPAPQSSQRQGEFFASLGLFLFDQIKKPI